MGITITKLIVKNPAKETLKKELDFLIDSGAVFSVVSKKILSEINIKPHRKQDFILADGTKITRQIGDAIFEMNGIKAASPVIFGEKNDSTLLGVVTLEALGFVLDPFKREIKPAKLLMV